MTDNLIRKPMKCLLCSVTASHQIEYTNLLQPDIFWRGWYCTKCFIKKLQGMSKIYKKRLVEAVAT